MMGFYDEDKKGSTFLTLFGHKWAKRIQDPIEGCVTRKLTKGANEGKEVHEIHRGVVDGRIISGGIETKEFSGKKVKEAHIEIEDDDGDRFTLQIPLKSGAYSTFAKVCRKIDTSKVVVFKLFPDKTSGKAVLNIVQDGSVIHQEFTRDNPGECPQPVKKVVQGEETWDWTDTENFLYGVVIDFFAGIDPSESPQTANQVPDALTGESEVVAHDTVQPTEEYEDDIPF